MSPHLYKPTPRKHSGKNGFSLIELSVVLTIIALLAGGIFVGQNVLRGAKLKTIGTDFSHYQEAVVTFRDQYMELPGDMSQATDYWGTAANCPGTSAQGTTDGTTCNGDGNGLIKHNAPTSNETFRFWQHLANAGLIDGVYNGVTGPGHANYHNLEDINSPGGPLNDTAWTVRHLGTYAGHPVVFAGNHGHVIYFGGTNDIGTAGGSILSPKELYKIDLKIDDGYAGKGKVMARNWDDCTDAADETVASAETANYLLSVEEEVCAIAFPNAF